MTISPELENHWALKPKQGLGEIRFGMTSEEVANFESIIGPAQSKRPAATTKEAFFSSLLPLKDLYGPGKIAELWDFYQENNKELLGVMLEYRDSGITLSYDNDHLVDIMANKRAENLQFNGRLVFAIPPSELVKEISSSLEEKPLIRAEDVVFPKNYIYLFNFLYSPKTSRGLEIKEGDPKERTISWGSRERNVGETFEGYEPLVLD